MRALVIDSVEADQTNLAVKRPVLRHIPFGERNGECRIRVTYAGICGTDLELIRGYADYTGIPGHEFVGVVEDAPDRDRHWIGKRVVGEINASCGACNSCIAGVREHCPTRSV
ncbi:MAG: alcohol dehydrogenase catalytic domain-containing protein, partial [Vicinamibacterales bacterium]